MQLGVIVPNKGPLALPSASLALARQAEQAGMDSLWAADHIVTPRAFEHSYAFGDEGNPANYGGEMPHAEALTWLAFVASATSRIRLGTGVLIVPQRDPLLMAKQLATIDLLSAGRVFVGVGVGWMREEFDAFGVEFSERGARTDDCIEAMRAVWAGAAGYDGKFTRYNNVEIVPRPARPGGLPLVVGGHSKASAVRTGRYGDGWFPSGDDKGRMGIEHLQQLWAIVRASAHEVGRDPDAIEITCIMPRTDDDIRRMADLGVARFVAPPLAEYDTGLPAHVSSEADIPGWIEAYVERVRRVLPDAAQEAK